MMKYFKITELDISAGTAHTLFDFVEEYSEFFSRTVTVDFIPKETNFSFQLRPKKEHDLLFITGGLLFSDKFVDLIQDHNFSGISFYKATCMSKLTKFCNSYYLGRGEANVNIDVMELMGDAYIQCPNTLFIARNRKVKASPMKNRHVLLSKPQTNFFTCSNVAALNSSLYCDEEVATIIKNSGLDNIRLESVETSF